MKINTQFLKSISNSSEENPVVEEKGDDSDSFYESWIFAYIQSIFSGNNEATTNTSSAVNKKPDSGALNWKVDFQTLTIKAFDIALLTQKLGNTSRIWKMSYLDDDTCLGKFQASFFGLIDNQ